MRSRLSAVFAITVVWAAPALGQQVDAARATIDWGIRAHGGETAQAKLKNAGLSAKGTINVVGTNTPATRDGQWALPDKLRWTLEFKAGEQKQIVVMVLNGPKGWRTLSGSPAAELTIPEYDAIREETYVRWVTTLVPLAQKEFALSAAPDVQVNGQPAAGVKVARKDRPDVLLYFDKSKHYLVKAAFKGSEAGQMLTKETTFADFKTFEGVQLPTKLTDLINGRTAGDWVVQTYTFPAKVDPALFNKP